MTVRLVTFDIVHTLITPRMPIHVQYAMAFKPYLGDVDPNSVKGSFKIGDLMQDRRRLSKFPETQCIALKALQMEKPAYEQGSQSWWTDVIRRTALGVGVNPQVLDVSLGNIVPNLMKVFSSKEGYMEFEDVLPTLHALHKRQIYTAVISNSDSRSRSVLTDLELPNYMIPIVLSEEEGIEKPTKEIFLRTLERVNYIRGERIRPEQCVHVGDELDADYYGAVGAGMRALLLRRTGPESKQDEDLNGVEVIRRLDEILHYTEQFAVSRR